MDLSFITVLPGCRNRAVSATHPERMANFYLPLALFLLLSCPAQAQWLSFICGNPKASPSSPSISSPSVASSEAKKPTEWLLKEDMVKSVEGDTHSPGGSGTVQPGPLVPDKAADGGSSQYKPLKQWKCGEYQETSFKNIFKSLSGSRKMQKNPVEPSS